MHAACTAINNSRPCLTFHNMLFFIYC